MEPCPVTTITGDFIYTATATTNAADAAAPTTALFAHVATGGGYSTAFTLVNTGSTPVSGTLILTGQDGAPLNASLAEPGAASVLASQAALSIPPGGCKIIVANPPNANDGIKAGWAHVESTGGALAGVANFQQVSGGNLTSSAGVLSAETMASATIPVFDDEAVGVFTGFAVANPSGSDTIAIKVVTVNADGSQATTLSPITLRPGEQVARFFFQDPAASKTFNGTAVLIGQDGKKFAVVALSQDRNLVSAIPVTAGKAAHIN